MQLIDLVKVMKIAHVLNVTEINDSKKSSYLHIAQPLTMKSMVTAKKVAKNVVDIELVALKHKAERVSIPAEFRWAADLDKYAWENIEALKGLTFHKPLPLLKDIILSLYNSSNAEYFIYTNLDIGLRPNFYLKVREFIEKGYDAFCINRRDLPKEYGGVLLDESTVELAYNIDGIMHPGIDCFVFKREIVPSLSLGNVYIGYPPVGQVLKTQIEINSRNFVWIKDERLTFHIGSDEVWRNSETPYYKENYKQSEGLYVNPFHPKLGLYRRFSNKLKSLICKTSR
ncbi:MAG: hypothetical protein AAF215_16580 [Cyanobacteria bacterium P01_A01_bin.123]